jgi:phosphatidylglycerol:prolipoprotein diacylglycerol transferase
VFPHEYYLGPLLINGYGAMVIASIILGFVVQRWTAPPAGLTPGLTRDLSFWMVCAGLVGSRLFYVALHWSRYKSGPVYEIFDWFGGGLMFQGGLLAAALVAFLLLRRGKISFLRAGDALAPALSLGQAVGRVGCFLAGCCHGRTAPDNFPFSVSFPEGGGAPSGVPLYPTELMECFGLLALTSFLFLRLKKSPYTPGRVLGFYLLFSGLLRFVLDYYRGDNRGPLVFGMAPTSYIALGIFLAGACLLFFASSARRTGRFPKWRGEGQI